MILNGKKLALEIEEQLKVRVAQLKRARGVVPKLVAITIGNFPQNTMYVNMKGRACERVGIEFSKIELDENVNTVDVVKIINDLNNDKSVHGIMLQHPVPAHINEAMCCDTIALSKDVDGLNSHTFGARSLGEDCFTSATPLGIITLLKHYNIEMDGKHAVVVGRSAILGKPVAMLLLNENATVTICHSKTVDLPKILKDADIIIGAVGKPHFIQPEWVKRGVVLVDAGYNEGNVGDIDVRCNEYAYAYTPVPGGVGPMTIAMLLTQLYESAEKSVCKEG